MDLQLNLQTTWHTNKAPRVVRAALSLMLALVFVVIPITPSGAQIEQIKYIQKKLENVKKHEASGNKQAYADALYDLATAYNNDEDYESALKYYEDSLAVEKTLNRPENRVDAQIQVARVLLMLRRLDQAFEKFNAAIAYCNEHKISSAGAETSLATTLFQIGKLKEAEQHYRNAMSNTGPKEQLLKAKLLKALSDLCLQTSRYDEGLGYIQEEVKIRSSQGDEGDYGRAMVGLADYQNRAGKPLDSMKTLEAVKAKFNADVFPDVLALAEFGIAENFYERQKIEEARVHYADAVKFARANETDTKLLLKCLIGLGVAEADLEHFNEAEKAHKEALELAEANSLREQLIEAEVQLSQDYLIQGSPERALHFLMKALKQTPEADKKSRGNVIGAIARCYSGLGQYPSAAKYYQEAAAIFGELQDNPNRAMTLNSLAVLYLDKGDFATFDRVYGQAKEVFASLPARDRAKLDFNDAQSKVIRGRYAEAIAVYNEALREIQDSGDEGLQSAILRGLGTSSYLSGDYRAALDYYSKAQAMSQDSGSIETLWDCNLGVGKSYKALRQLKEAEPYLRRAVALVERERSNLTRDSFKTYNLDLRKDCFQELVDLLVRTDRAYESLEIAERGKARAFLDMMANRKERRIASVDIAPSGPASPPSKPPAQQPILVAMADPGSRSVTISGKLEADVPEETAISPINADPPTVDEIKTLVANRRSTCVEFLLANNHIYTWVVKPDGAINMVPPLVVPEKFNTRVADLLALMTKSAKTPAEMQALGLKRQAELRALYTMLIKPVEQYLPQNKDEVITIIPHDVLFRIPFAALMADNGDYLIERHTLSYAPAIGVLRATQKLQQQSQGGSHNLLAFGNPITERIAFLGALPYSEKEVKSIAQIFGATNSTTEIGAAATKAKFNDLAPNASEIHLATHGLVDEEHPMKSALVLAPTDKDDGMLSVRDILTMKNLKARIVVLSACQTGRGKITGDGVVGLSRAFIIAGAPSVLVSQWNVDDIMTAYQMERFYKFYLKGADRARALRDAQLATINYMEDAPAGTVVAHSAGKVRANPRYWAAFQLIGEI